MTTDPQITTASLYRYFDKYGILIYAGITAQRTARNQQHNRDKPWWPLVDRQEVEHFDTRADALAAETKCIQQCTPPFNRQQNPDQEDINRAYEMFLSSGLGDQDPTELLRREQYVLPLVALREYGTFRTKLEHAPIALRLRDAKDVRVVIGTQCIGNLRHPLVHRGPLVKISTMMRGHQDLSGAVIKVKRVAERGPAVFEIRHLRLPECL